MVQAYCVKCRSKKEMKDSKAITMKNGKPATQGTLTSDVNNVHETSHAATRPA